MSLHAVWHVKMSKIKWENNASKIVYKEKSLTFAHTHIWCVHRKFIDSYKKFWVYLGKEWNWRIQEIFNFYPSVVKIKQACVMSGQTLKKKKHNQYFVILRVLLFTKPH